MNGISGRVRLNLRHLYFCKENPGLCKRCKWQLSIYPGAARPLLPLGGSILMCKTCSWSLYRALSLGESQRHLQRFVNSDSHHLFTPRSTVPRFPMGVRSAECYMVTAWCCEWGVAELEPKLSFCRTQAVSLLSPCVTAGDSSHVLWGFCAQLAARTALSLGRVTLGYSDTRQMKDDRGTQGIPVLYRQMNLVCFWHETGGQQRGWCVVFWTGLALALCSTFPTG